jgi:hypothetical protein
MHPFPMMVILGLYGDATLGARATDPTLTYVPRRTRRPGRWRARRTGGQG